MRAVVIFFSGKNRDAMMRLAKALGKGIEKQGNQVDVFDGAKDTEIKLTMYQYIVVGAEPAGMFGGKIPDAVGTFLAAAGLIQGKKSYAFVSKSTFGAEKSLARLMKSMEKEGMLLKNSDILRSPTEAEEIGKRLHIA
jgi:menaquinone-dependent protoporphyrinogen IX oxidase